MKPFERHGETASGSQSPEYYVWHGMINRCYCSSDTNFKRYGGRGIQVCARWRQSFVAFLQDVGWRPTAKHQIERKDNTGNYEPDNVRWATSKEQNRNRRGNRLITINGITRCIAEWAELSGLNPTTLWGRCERDWPEDKLLVQPQGTGRWTKKGFNRD